MKRCGTCGLVRVETAEQRADVAMASSCCACVILEAHSPEDGEAIVRDGEAWLIMRPPYRESGRHGLGDHGPRTIENFGVALGRGFKSMVDIVTWLETERVADAKRAELAGEVS